MNRIFILENKSHLGFKKDLMKSCEGLDYEHSVLGTYDYAYHYYDDDDYDDDY